MLPQQKGEGIATRLPPTSKEEFDALFMWRSELRDQVGQLQQRRAVLVMERNAETDRAELAQLKTRIAESESRIAVLDKQIARADELILNAVGKFSAAEGAPAPVGIAPGVPPEWQTSSLDPGRGPGGFSLGPDVGRVMALEAVVFVLLGVVGWRFMLRSFEKRLLTRGDAGSVVKLQQAIDTIAVEVERISENQRYVTKLLADKAPEVGAGEARK